MSRLFKKNITRNIGEHTKQRHPTIKGVIGVIQQLGKAEKRIKTIPR